ncbi:MAG: hypothetical protein M1587_11335 [Thaumarchaeota archaeon]|nr:hypothetical protein [Nitrososphaerota archaeon]
MNEIQLNAAGRLGKRNIDRKTVFSALSQLVNQSPRFVEESLIGGKRVYNLSTRFYQQSLFETFGKLISRSVDSDIGKLLDNAMTNEGLPYTIYITPPQGDEYEVADRAGRSLSVEWESPADGIAGTLYNDFLMLDESTRNGIAMLIAWGYWLGIRDQIDNFLGAPLVNKLEELRKFATEVREKRLERGDQVGANGESAINPRG